MGSVAANIHGIMAWRIGAQKQVRFSLEDITDGELWDMHTPVQNLIRSWANDIY